MGDEGNESGGYSGRAGKDGEFFFVFFFFFVVARVVSVNCG